MARTKRGYILSSCFLSGFAAIISFVALGTQEWIWANAKTYPDIYRNYIRVGLFGGYFHQESTEINSFDLTMACDFGLNVCALLCGENLVENVGNLYNGAPDGYKTCQPFQTGVYNDFGIKTETRPNVVPVGDRIFVNAGVWISTIVFLVASALFGLISCSLAMINTIANYQQFFLNTMTLYVSNGLALFSIILSMSLWGGMFAQDLIQCVPTYQTIVGGFSTNGGASLGYSYWINFISMVFYIFSIYLLYLRSYIKSKQPNNRRFK